MIPAGQKANINAPAVAAIKRQLTINNEQIKKKDVWSSKANSASAILTSDVLTACNNCYLLFVNCNLLLSLTLERKSNKITSRVFAIESSCFKLLIKLSLCAHSSIG